MIWTRVPTIALLVSLLSVLRRSRVASLGEGTSMARDNLFGLVGLAATRRQRILDAAPLGFESVVTRYAFGIVLSVVGGMRTKLAASAMLPFGVVAFIFSGTLAKMFGVVINFVGKLVFFAHSRQIPA